MIETTVFVGKVTVSKDLKGRRGVPDYHIWHTIRAYIILYQLAIQSKLAERAQPSGTST